MSAFNGFQPDFFSFLEDLKSNNNRDWFNAHKSDFKQQVQQPMVAFIEAIEPDLMKISPYFVADARLNGGSMFRIYRDTRFSKDKTPYKTHAAAQFRHNQYKNVHTPGFYLHLEPGKVLFGGGIWLPESKTLLAIRQLIADKPRLWRQVIGNEVLCRTHGGVAGDGLIRPPKGFSSDSPHIEDIKRKNFFAMTENDSEMALEKDFLNQVVNGFEAAAPLVEFLCKALEIPY